MLFSFHWPGKASLIRCHVSKEPSGGKEKAVWVSGEGVPGPLSVQGSYFDI